MLRNLGEEKPRAGTQRFTKGKNLNMLVGWRKGPCPHTFQVDNSGLLISFTLFRPCATWNSYFRSCGRIQYAMSSSLCIRVRNDAETVADKGGPNGTGPDRLPTKRSEAHTDRSDEVRGCEQHITQTRSLTQRT